jgi:hypothetical protein
MQHIAVRSRMRNAMQHEGSNRMARAVVRRCLADAWRPELLELRHLPPLAAQDKTTVLSSVSFAFR